MSDEDDAGVEHGERYAKSPLTGNYYRVTSWEDRGEGRIISHSKEEVERSEVPNEWLDALDDWDEVTGE